ncbi:hypothetical protein BDK51DRAFT_25608 [Blyttiomyces helicus]|uniref:Uncharacterized protein n=1 Tax=Blyttiomyces helicus TaxID=388810 RepID=A0A4P9WML8_9FUNG|nr:hypothetical protein BDK51DRAFT_25608 [Blyttiomyces helicus]|eukprot:RKO93475.1 hypothetical protein BDK51DRAFT_25608 [Blyttiomyces helicus]
MTVGYKFVNRDLNKSPALQFKKLYFIHLLNYSLPIPAIDKRFVTSVMKLSLPLNYLNLGTVLDYLAIDAITIYENNIKQHYVEYVERLVNSIWGKKQMITLIKKRRNLTSKDLNNKINNLCVQLRKIKNDMLNTKEPKTS